MAEPAPAGAAEALPATALSLKRVLASPAEEVWRAWTDPERFRRWFMPPGGSNPATVMDVRPGGRFRITMRVPIGWDTFVVGRYLEVRPPELLVFSFGWERLPPLGISVEESRVTVRLRALEQGTELHLLHELLPRRAQRGFHAAGWRSSLRGLEALLRG